MPYISCRPCSTSTGYWVTVMLKPTQRRRRQLWQLRVISQKTSFYFPFLGRGSFAYSSLIIHTRAYTRHYPTFTYIFRKPLYVPPPQKHYKIVFIKAPSPPAPTAPIIPQFPQNEEKTLVYVLVKKPEEQPEIVIPTPAPTQPSKPEVYFIRYKTQKEETGPYPNSIAPPQEYGAPAAPPAPSAPSSSYGAPSH